MQDFLLDEDGDLLIQNGDFAVGPSDQQHIQDIIESFPGWFKQFPALGVGIQQYLKGTDPQLLIASVKQQLKSDGYNVNNIKVSEGPDHLEISFPGRGITR